MNEKPVIKNVIARCGADKILPIGIVYMFYIILHGHLSPGGGFQGGVLVAGALLLCFLGYGHRTNYHGYEHGYIPRVETLAEIVYIAVAVAGIIAGGNFCLNIILSRFWEIETAQIMSDAVGVNVFTGISCLMILMLAVLMRGDDEEGSELK